MVGAEIENVGSRVALLPPKFLPSGKFFLYIFDTFWTKSGIFLDSMEHFHLFWKSFQTISASGQDSNKIPEKINLFWNICRKYGKVSVLLEKFPDNICSRTSFQQDSKQNLFCLEHFQIVWKRLNYSGKVSGQYLFPDKFPTRFGQIYLIWNISR